MNVLADLAAQNLLSPMVLSFALGFLAGRLKSDLSIPEAASKAIALYLMVAIGWKGGTELAHAGLTAAVAASAFVAVGLSLTLPAVAFALLRLMTRVNPVTAAAIAAHYGSVSVVTFVATTAFLSARHVAFEGHVVVMMALMETPAIVAGLLLARRFATERRTPGGPLLSRELAREVFLSGSVVLLLGSFGIAWVSGTRGAPDVLAPLVGTPFKAVLCFFLLDMGLLAARRLGGASGFDPRLLIFGLVMPLVGAVIGLGAAWVLSLSAGGGTLLAALTASASYIVVPAAMRLALPEANPGVYVTLALGVTFPFNLVVGIPLYHVVARAWLPLP
ncbi:MAG: sodium-dependent bicarbonate transport family permease [Myxococcales bacterium]|nr:sodium-dependent bicarbonate transport family permease [Myxococcales bacterium]